MTVLSIDKPDLQIDEVVAVARERIPVEVSAQAVDRIERSRGRPAPSDEHLGTHLAEEVIEELTKRHEAKLG